MSARRLRKVRVRHRDLRGEKASPGGRRAIRTAVLLMGIALVVAGIVVLAPLLMSRVKAASVTAPTVVAPPGQPTVEPDWEGLEAEADTSASVVGWLRVGGTSLDTAVVQGRDNRRFLHHDLWGSPSWIGWPFLDSRVKPDGPNVVIYGHHVAGTSLMFSELADCRYQSNFDRLGTCAWTVRGPSSERVCRPLCAMRVPEDYGPVQQVDPEDMAEWLSGMLSDATARAPDAEELTKKARSAVTLVTCSEVRSNQPWRTVVVFVEV